MRTTTNRTNWPINGGAIALQPGWFQGHATAFFYMNMGFGTNGPDNGPPNMSFPMVPVFQIVGPSKNPYPGTICLPQVPLPSGIPTPNVGDNATIQVVETAIHGAALYSVSPQLPRAGRGKIVLIDEQCVDITFTEPENVAQVNESNCFNSSDISFNNVYSIAIGPTSDSTKTLASIPLLPMALLGIAWMIFL
jgi:hypothetical protein